MAIVIKKKVSLGFLGEEYKDAYLTFQSIPLKDFDLLQDKIKEAEDNKKAASFILDTLKRYFVEGIFPGIDTLTKEDLDGLDQESVIKCFSIFTGQEINKQSGEEVAEVQDLKEESVTQSSTEQPGPEN